MRLLISYNAIVWRIEFFCFTIINVFSIFSDLNRIFRNLKKKLFSIETKLIDNDDDERFEKKFSESSMQINCENSLIVFLISFLIWSTVILKNIFMISKYFICMNFRYILIFLCSWIISFFAFNKTAIFNVCYSCFFISIIHFFVWSLKIYLKSFSSMKKKSDENSKSKITDNSNESICYDSSNRRTDYYGSNSLFLKNKVSKMLTKFIRESNELNVHEAHSWVEWIQCSRSSFVNRINHSW